MCTWRQGDKDYEILFTDATFVFFSEQMEKLKSPLGGVMELHVTKPHLKSPPSKGTKPSSE